MTLSISTMLHFPPSLIVSTSIVTAALPVYPHPLAHLLLRYLLNPSILPQLPIIKLTMHSEIHWPLSSSEVQQLSSSLRMRPEDLRAMIDSGRFERLRVDELKDVIRFYKDRMVRLWRMHPPIWMSLYGRKADLLAVVQRTVAYRPEALPHQQQLPPSTPIRVPPSSQPYRSPNAQYSTRPNRPLLSIQPFHLNEAMIKKQRGPFALFEKLLAQTTLVENNYASINCELDTELLHALRRSADHTGRIKVFLRLVSSDLRTLVPWDPNFTLIVNGSHVALPQKIKESKKQLSFRSVKGIDLSPFLGQKNNIRILSRIFFGVAVLEVDRVFNVDHVMQKIEERSKPIYKCALCQEAHPGVKRCSMCKHVYYCDEKHQLEDWGKHRTVCKANPTTPPMSPKYIADVSEQGKKSENPENQDDDDEIEEMTQMVSLTCPLMIDRINVPAKGIHCKHTSCFDLKTFLLLAHESYNWQCPICLKPLAEPDIRIDHKMSAILQLAPPESEQVRFSVDGSIEFPKEDEAGSNDASEGDASEPESEPVPPFKRPRVEEVISIIDDPRETPSLRRGSLSSEEYQQIMNAPIPGSREEPIELD
jgi:hypothetical protein